MQPIFCRLRRRALRLALLPAVFLLLAALCALPADAAAPAGTYVRTPAAPGTVVHSNAKAGFDASNASQGYIMAWYAGTSDKVKVQITGGGSTYTYNLNTAGRKEVFPLTMGDGSYTVAVYERVTGNQYALAYSKQISVKLESAFLPFLYPNQYVNFSASSRTVSVAGTLAADAADQLGVVTNIYNYVISHITYDSYKAANVQSGYLPSVDSTLAAGTGICFDYAAVMAAMLRSQQIPTRLEVGYVSGGTYHAWISTYIAEVGWVDGIIQFDGKSWKLMDPTFASNGGSSPEIMQFIGNGANYQMKYRY
ncbi:MAG: transglutaminase-like domain-containing protein [Anaerotruncus massiliensis (ex Togo et al. 2019)]